MVTHREHRLIHDHDFYYQRTLNRGEFQNYADVSGNPLKPLAALPHLADGAFRISSDLARTLQTNPRPIKSLKDRGRFVDSAIGTVQDAGGALLSAASLKPVDAAGKAVGAVLSVGDAALGLASDGSDLITGADVDRHKYN
jgi:hypothetical protein